MRIYIQLASFFTAIVIMLSCAPKQGKLEQKQKEVIPVVNESETDIKEKIYTDSLDTEVEPNEAIQVPIKEKTLPQTTFKYDLSRPVKTSILERELIEISGLSFDTKKNVIYAVNDEKGNLYSLNPEDGKIINREKFGKRGDYEGVELLDNGLIYALKSNGNLVEIDLQNNEFTTIRTELRTANDVEGLGYVAQKNILLLACKGTPSLSKSTTKTKKVKAVYSWSLTSSTLSEDPYLEISDDALLEYFATHEPDVSKSKKKKLKKRLADFSPSAIAYNKKEDLFYILSSVGKLLVLVDRTSAVQHVEFLDNTYFVQPEGICFDQENNLYISNEGKGLVAKLLKFELQ